MIRAYGPAIVLIAAAALVPFAITANTVLNFIVFALIIALAAQGWNVLGGLAGQFSFGHAAFFGSGAYTTALLQTHWGVNAWVAFALSILLAGAVGWIIGFLSFRSGLRGSYFALVTLAFAEVLRILANASTFTGGAAGTLVKLDMGPANFQFASRAAFVWIALALVGFVLIATIAIMRSRFGAWLTAVRENEDAARALGVDTLAVKLKAITLSAAITGAAGALYVQYYLYLDASIAYGPWISIEALVAPIVGGIGTAFGPILGAAALHGFGELTKLFAGGIPGIDLVLYGLLLIATIAFAPDGIMGLLKRLASVFDRRRTR
ncbi:branched-chain amino acid ABC transporter permease [Bosea sp. BH3]|uniref:branched-chain amino acid ABC transporter permease n=1 Tax=Bosea sp. BH3 TaxID=2871701 RepID=UPI0021CAE4A2|nr:branched-chain amino acid ABC transporter permease [Bosea sp. BH3]MCU4179616.1 branched-chain amino acid ABC transporter permease [Bosea sp. BH3]